MLVSAVTNLDPYAGSAFTRVIEGCFLATLLFSKGSSCLVLNDFWSRDIVPSCVLRGAALYLFYKLSAAERRQPPKARQPLSIPVVVGSSRMLRTTFSGAAIWALRLALKLPFDI